MRREKNFWKGLQEGLLEGSSVVVPCYSLGSPRRGLRPGISPAFSQLPNESMIKYRRFLYAIKALGAP